MSAEMAGFARATGVVGGIGGFVIVASETGEFGPSLIGAAIGFALGAFVGQLVWRAVVWLVGVSFILLRFGMCFARLTASEPSAAPPTAPSYNPPPSSASPSYIAPTPAPVFAPASVTRELRFSNTCSRPLELWIRYKDATGSWVNRGIWTIAAGKNTFLAHEEQRLQLSGSELYYYAEIAGDRYSWYGDNAVTFGGRELKMRRSTVSTGSDGALFLELDCNNYDTVMATPAPQPVIVTRELRFSNACSRPIDLWLKYKDANGSWIDRGVWNISAGKKTFIADENKRLQLSDSDIYYYAEIPGDRFSWSGEHVVNYNGRELKMRRKAAPTDSAGAFFLELTCSNVSSVSAPQAPAPAPAIATRELRFSNTCSRPLELWIRYKDYSGNWINRGIWSIAAGKNTLLSHEKQNLQLSDSELYYYAEIPSERYSWQGDNAVNFGGRELKMRRRVVSPDAAGAFFLEVDCNNYSPAITNALLDSELRDVVVLPDGSTKLDARY